LTLPPGQVHSLLPQPRPCTRQADVKLAVYIHTYMPYNANFSFLWKGFQAHDRNRQVVSRSLEGFRGQASAGVIGQEDVRRPKSPLPRDGYWAILPEPDRPRQPCCPRR
jgi:hypothetical protein